MSVQVLAVREGTVRLHGQPKLPTWTLLNSTADQGDTTINVNGPINWVVGDRIAIASSSFYATDVDEATVTNVTCVTAGCEVVQLGLDTVLNYTHLGEVVTVPGDDRGHVLDMRAEVAVLNRYVPCGCLFCLAPLEGHGFAQHSQCVTGATACCIHSEMQPVAGAPVTV